MVRQSAALRSSTEILLRTFAVDIAARKWIDVENPFNGKYLLVYSMWRAQIVSLDSQRKTIWSMAIAIMPSNDISKYIASAATVFLLLHEYGTDVRN